MAIKMKQLILIGLASLLWFCGITCVVEAAESNDDDFNIMLDDSERDSNDAELDEFGFELEDEEENQALTIERQRLSAIEMGLLYQDSNHYFTHRYYGLDDLGWYPQLNYTAYLTPGSDAKNYFNLDLGLLGNEFGNLNLDWGIHGLFKQSIEYQQSIQLNNDSAGTIFTNPGADRLLLPGDWVAGTSTANMSQLKEPLNEFDPNLKRKSAHITHQHKLNRHWQLYADLKMDQKDGVKPMGAAIYFNAANPHSVILPEPVDSQTSDLDFEVQYQRDKLNFNTAYAFSNYDNKIDNLSWQNPYGDVISTAVDYPLGFGSIGQPVDNTQQSLRMYGQYIYSPKLTLQWDGALGLLTQDEPFLPYSVHSDQLATPTDLPSTNLDGEIFSRHINAALLFNPKYTYSLALRYRHELRDNKTPRQLFQYLPGDATPTAQPLLAVYNYRVGFEKDRVSLEGRYRFPKRIQFKGELSHERISRQNYAVDVNREDRLLLAVKSHPLHNMTTEISFIYSDRAASSYDWAYDYYAMYTADLINLIPDNQRYTNHPQLRQYFIANREQQEWKLNLQYLINSAWNVSGELRWQWQDYDRTVLGLRSRENQIVNLQSHYVSSQLLSFYAYYQWVDNDDEQMGWQFSGGADKSYNDISVPLFEASDASRIWSVNNSNQYYAFGTGFELKIVPGKLTYQFDYSRVNTQVNYEFANSGSADLDAMALPESSSELHQIYNEFTYHVDKQTRVLFGLGYYQYLEKDWAFDTVLPDTLASVIGTGEQPANESVRVIAMSIYHEF